MRQAFFFAAIKFTYDSRGPRHYPRLPDSTVATFARERCTFPCNLPSTEAIVSISTAALSWFTAKEDGGVAHLRPTFRRLTRCSGISRPQCECRWKILGQPCGWINRCEISRRFWIFFLFFSRWTKISRGCACVRVCVYVYIYIAMHAEGGLENLSYELTLSLLANVDRHL